MREVDGWLVEPDGQIPQFGFSDLVDAPDFAQREARRDDGMLSLIRTGLAVVRQPGSYLSVLSMFHSLAHKQADDLSFDLFDAGLRIVSDTGLYNKDRNDYYEFATSAAAHSTLTVDGEPFPLDEQHAYGSGLIATGQPRLVRDPGAKPPTRRPGGRSRAAVSLSARRSARRRRPRPLRPRACLQAPLPARAGGEAAGRERWEGAGEEGGRGQSAGARGWAPGRIALELGFNRGPARGCGARRHRPAPRLRLPELQDEGAALDGDVRVEGKRRGLRHDVRSDGCRACGAGGGLEADRATVLLGRGEGSETLTVRRQGDNLVVTP